MGEELRPGDPERIGEYRVIDVLGGGGMGQVYLCLSPGGRRVAVKVIRADLAADPEFRHRFKIEVETAGKVNGACTASLLGSNLDGPVLWLATSYAGPSLAQVVTRYGPLPVRTVLALAAGLAEGLAAIHAEGVVHRDLKPSNVLLAQDGPRVIDFGISRAVSEGSVLTETGTVFGSPGYMSPEQADGLRVDARSDVFSLGAVLTYAAAGHGPFGGGEPAALLYRVVHHPPDLHDVPAEIRGLAGRCLAKAPADRPTLTELLAELGDTHLSSGWLPAHVTAGFFRDEPAPARVSVGAPAPAAAAAGQSADPGADTIVRPIASAAWAPPDVRPDREPTDARPGQDPLGGPGAALIFQDADRHPNGTGLTLPYTPEPAPGRGPSGPTGPSGPNEPSGPAGLSRAGAWDRIRRLRGRRLLLAAGAGVVLIALLTTALVVLTAGPGPFHPRLRSVLTGPPSQGLTTVAFSPDNSLLAAAGNGGSGYVWTAADGRLTTTLPDPASGGVTDIAFSPAGGLLATADSNGHAFLWSATTGQLTRTLTDTGSGGLAGLAFSPHGNLLAAAGHNGQVNVWTVFRRRAGPQLRRTRGRQPDQRRVQPGRQPAGRRGQQRARLRVDGGHREAHHPAGPRQRRRGRGRVQPGRQPAGHRGQQRAQLPVDRGHREARRHPARPARHERGGGRVQPGRHAAGLSRRQRAYVRVDGEHREAHRHAGRSGQRRRDRRGVQPGRQHAGDRRRRRQHLPVDHQVLDLSAPRRGD